MGIKKTRQSNIDDAKAIYTDLLDELLPVLKPYFALNGQLDSNKLDLITKNTSALFARILDCRISIEENSITKYFCADAILPE